MVPRDTVAGLMGIALALFVAAASAQEITPEREAELFGKIDSMIIEVEEITGFKALQPIPRSLLSRDEINDLVSTRLEEETEEDQFRLEELFLELFGLTPQRVDLEQQVVDVLTEQAAALYDYKTKQLYIATWAPDDMQEFALVHEIAHALADQQFDLEKYITGGKSADADLALMAVVEGQASWVMTEWVMRQSHRTLAGNRLLAAAAVGASRYEVQNYPVFTAAPRYIQETMIFPYTEGLMFQQAVFDTQNQSSFGGVFADPPASTQHILNPESYFENRRPLVPKVPKVKLKRFKRSARGDIGQLDHYILLDEHFGEADSKLASHWRGAQYEIWENRNHSRAVFLYASQWRSAADARKFFEFYSKVCEKKWESVEILSKTEGRIEGRSDSGRFVITLDDETVTSVEGLSDDNVGLQGRR